MSVTFLWAVVRTIWAFVLALPSIVKGLRCTRWKRDAEQDRLERLRHPERFSVR
jgi:hypothetical protein